MLKNHRKQAKIPLLWTTINLIFTAILGYMLKEVYIRYGSTLSNRDSLGKVLILISTTTMLIITIVKSSLALSLGLVGALSIIRFRAAIKEPEELAYLFIAISIGLGLGAQQLLVTLVSFIIIVAIIIIIGKNQTFNSNSMFLKITIDKAKDVNIDKIIKILNLECVKVKLKRYDENENLLEMYNS